MTDQADIAALLGSRICHDLISPIGAIGNGVELVMMDGAQRGPEMALIGESVASASARIRFFRVAFGLASAEQSMGRAEVVAILDDLTRGGRTQIDWQALGDMSRLDAKLLFLAINCLESALAFGGRITVTREQTRWSLTGQSQRLKLEPATWDLLSNPAAQPALTPALVQFALLPLQIRAQSRRLVTELRETEIRISF